MHLAIYTGTQSLVKQEKKDLQTAYQAEESKIIENKTKELEQKYYHDRHTEAWKIINEIAGTSNRQPRSSTFGTPAQLKENWYKHFSELLNKPSTALSYDPVDKVVNHTLPIDTSPFTMEELNIAIKKTNPETTVGPDCIPLELWSSPQISS